MSAQSHILVVDHDPRLAHGLRRNLELEGYRVSVRDTGTSALDSARRNGVDLMILELMLPDRDGIHVLRELRSEDAALPVLILSARTAPEDRIRGLRAGADDYLAKPVSVLELLARIEALLRRRRWNGGGDAPRTGRARRRSRPSASGRSKWIPLAA